MFPQRFTHALFLGIRSLRAHRLRSGLTTLGIVLGVASVIVMLAVGEAARYQALKQLEDLGANTIILRSVKPTDEPDSKKVGVDLTAYGLTPADVERIRTTIPTIVTVNPMREYRKVARNKNNKLEARVVAITPNFLSQYNIGIENGRAINEDDERSYANVCLLGAEVADKLFPTENPIGKTVNLEHLDGMKAFTVIGITFPKTLAIGGGENSAAADFNKVIFIPFATDQVRFGREILTFKTGSFQFERLDMSQITVTVDKMENVARTATAIQSVIDQFHPRKDVNVQVPLDLLRKAEQTQKVFTLVLAAIAGISLLVGGIGIMNIMLATVTERTREIGVRRALGAKKRDISLQFLVETVLLSCGGGVIGVLVGVGLSYTVSNIFGLPTIIRAWSPILAFATSLMVGLLSGLIPASRAAKLDPIEALRHN